MQGARTIKGLKRFITENIHEEPDGNFCWYNMWPKIDVEDNTVIEDLQAYVNKKNIKYMFVVSNIEETRPQRTGEEPEFYRPSSEMRVFSKCEEHNNTFVIAFWGKCWGEDWNLDKILEGMEDFPAYAKTIRLEG